MEKHSTTNSSIREISVLMEKHSTTNALIIKNGFGTRKIYVLMEKHSTTNALIIKNEFCIRYNFCSHGKTHDCQCID